MASDNEFLVNSDTTYVAFMKLAHDLYMEHRYIEFKYKTGKQRTNLQNRALHLYFTMLAMAFKESEITLPDLIELPFVEVDLSIDAHLIKEKLWKPIQKALIDEESTAKAKRRDYTEVYDTLNRYTSDRFGISVPFPSKDKL